MGEPGNNEVSEIPGEDKITGENLSENMDAYQEPPPNETLIEDMDKKEEEAEKDEVKLTYITGSQTDESKLPAQEELIEKPVPIENLRVFTESEVEILDKLEMNDSEFNKFKNPFCESKISLSSWREDIQVLNKKTLNEKDVDSVIMNILEDNAFIIVFEEGTKKHRKMATLLSTMREPYYMVSANILKDSLYNGEFWDKTLSEVYNPPIVIYNNKVFRTVEELEELLYQRLMDLPTDVPESESMKENEFHLVVIGNSSAGFAAATKAREYCNRVALIDLPSATPGQAVRTAKKIMHSTGMLFRRIRLGYKYGFHDTGDSKISWNDLVEQITCNMKKMVFNKSLKLRKEGVRVIRAKAKFINEIEVELSVTGGKTSSTTSTGNFNTLKGYNYVIATGSKQIIPKDILGAGKYCIPSDKLLFLRFPPRNTLIVGDSIEALEYAGILSAFEYRVTVMVSISSSDFLEKEFLNEIQKDLEFLGVQFVENCKVVRVSASSNDKNKKSVEGLYNDGCLYSEEFDSVVLAYGRKPRTNHMGLSKARVDVIKTRYIEVDKYNRTSRANIYALGSVVKDQPRSQEVSKKSAEFLLERLFNCGTNVVENSLMPNIVLTPLEYASIGLTEELAEKIFFERFNHVSVYESHVDIQRNELHVDNVQVKMLTSDDGDIIRIVGFHILGYDVGETLQGISCMLEKDIYIQQFDKVLNMHLNPKIVHNTTLKRVISKVGSQIILPLDACDIKMVKDETIKLCSPDITKIGQPSNEWKPKHKEEKTYSSKAIEEKLIATQSSTFDTTEIQSELEQDYSMSESSSCESLYSQEELDFLKNKPDYMEISFETERVQEIS